MTLHEKKVIWTVTEIENRLLCCEFGTTRKWIFNNFQFWNELSL